MPENVSDKYKLNFIIILIAWLVFANPLKAVLCANQSIDRFPTIIRESLNSQFYNVACSVNTCSKDKILVANANKFVKCFFNTQTYNIWGIDSGRFWESSHNNKCIPTWDKSLFNHYRLIHVKTEKSNLGFGGQKRFGGVLPNIAQRRFYNLSKSCSFLENIPFNSAGLSTINGNIKSITSHAYPSNRIPDIIQKPYFAKGSFLNAQTFVVLRDSLAVCRNEDSIIKFKNDNKSAFIDSLRKENWAREKDNCNEFYIRFNNTFDHLTLIDNIWTTEFSQDCDIDISFDRKHFYHFWGSKCKWNLPKLVFSNK